ncbi:hypothetical protein LCGC14_2387590 [marine sediment metagenome]|uniref:Uncharacterized protein n=1 Tax=marine sediment metagenome TaxID=412755 RepID=A0A0F9ETT5_9ZZZZ
MAGIYQEFYCAKSGGGCGGYMTIRLNMAINGIVDIICPKCQHKHQRKIRDGVLTDDGRYSSTVTQEIIPTIAAWHKKAAHPESWNRVGGDKEREAVVIEDDPVAREFLKDRWFEIYGSGS